MNEGKPCEIYIICFIKYFIGYKSNKGFDNQTIIHKDEYTKEYKLLMFTRSEYLII